MSRPNNTDTLEQAGKAIHLIKRRRKTRHAKLREMAKEEEEGYRGRDAWSREIGGGEIVCPVCAATVKGDQDVLDAHVDACLANEGLRMEEERQRELELRRVSEEGAWEEVLDVDGTGGHVGDVRGMLVAQIKVFPCPKLVSRNRVPYSRSQRTGRRR